MTIMSVSFPGLKGCTTVKWFHSFIMISKSFFDQYFVVILCSFEFEVPVVIPTILFLCINVEVYGQQYDIWFCLQLWSVFEEISEYRCIHSLKTSLFYCKPKLPSPIWSNKWYKININLNFLRRRWERVPLTPKFTISLETVRWEYSKPKYRNVRFRFPVSLQG